MGLVNKKQTSSTSPDHCTIVWVTRSECPKGAKDKVKQAQGPKAGPKGRKPEVGVQRAPRLLVFDILHLKCWSLWCNSVRKCLKVAPLDTAAASAAKKCEVRFWCREFVSKIYFWNLKGWTQKKFLQRMRKRPEYFRLLCLLSTLRTNKRTILT